MATVQLDETQRKLLYDALTCAFPPGTDLEKLIVGPDREKLQEITSQVFSDLGDEGDQRKRFLKSAGLSDKWLNDQTWAGPPNLVARSFLQEAIDKGNTICGGRPGYTTLASVLDQMLRDQLVGTEDGEFIAKVTVRYNSLTFPAARPSQELDRLRQAIPPPGDLIGDIIDWAAADEQDCLADLIGKALEHEQCSAALRPVAERLGITPPRVRPTAETTASTWDELRAKSREQHARFLDPLVRKMALADLYVRRKIESEFTEFLATEDTAFILVGESGVGKTSLLSHWALELLGQGHAVFFYNCGASIPVEIEQTIARDLDLEDPDRLYSTLREIDALPAPAGSQFILVFDALEEFRRSKPSELLSNIDALVDRLEAKGRIRVVVSCNAATWRQMDRGREVQLFEDRYHRPHGEVEDKLYWLLGVFNDDELQAAYERYKQHFALQTPFVAFKRSMSEELRNPQLLNMLADAYRGKALPPGGVKLWLDIYNSYYVEKVGRPEDRAFLSELVLEMCNKSQSVLGVEELLVSEALSAPSKAAISSSNEDSSYYLLQENGVLLETPSVTQYGYEAQVVQFTYSRFGAFVLARALLSQPAVRKDPAQRGLELVRQANEFPIAWDTAVILVLQIRDPQLFEELADSTDPGMRELMVEVLVQLHAADASKGKDIILQLLQSDSKEGQRTALRASYRIGHNAKDIFMRVAREGSPELREEAKNFLYLLWRSNSKFVNDLLVELAASVTIKDLASQSKLLQFAIELAITIYINHPEQRSIAESTDRLFYEIAGKWLKISFVRAAIDLFSDLVSKGFTQNLLKAMMLGELSETYDLFHLPAQERAVLREVIAPLLDPRNDLAPALDRLAALMESEEFYFNIAAAHVLPVHAYCNYAKTEPLVRTLYYDKLQARGRLWVILSLGILLPETPKEWTGLLEELTRDFIGRHGEVFFKDSLGIFEKFDVFLVPLGLAYSKQNREMSYIKELLSDCIARGDTQQTARCLQAIGAVGFYSPEATLQTIEAAIPGFPGPLLAQPDLEDALVGALAIMRILHFELVDSFLSRWDLGDQLRWKVAAEVNMDQVRRYIYWVGLYNEVAQHNIFYPWMRHNLSMYILKLLGEATDAKAFDKALTKRLMNMYKGSNYSLIEWTNPNGPAGSSDL
jgi:hypothetical protein